MLHLAITKSQQQPPITQTLIPPQTKLHPDQLLKNREVRTHLV